jgi:hypothetical protein
MYACSIAAAVSLVSSFIYYNGLELDGITTLSDQWLQHGNNTSQPTFNVSIFLLNSLLGTQDSLKFLVRLLTCEFLYTALQGFDLILGTLANSALCFPI